MDVFYKRIVKKILKFHILENFQNLREMVKKIDKCLLLYGNIIERDLKNLKKNPTSIKIRHQSYLYFLDFRLSEVRTITILCDLNFLRTGLMVSKITDAVLNRAIDNTWCR